MKKNNYKELKRRAGFDVDIMFQILVRETINTVKETELSMFLGLIMAYESLDLISKDEYNFLYNAAFEV